MKLRMVSISLLGLLMLSCLAGCHKVSALEPLEQDSLGYDFTAYFDESRQDVLDALKEQGIEAQVDTGFASGNVYRIKETIAGQEWEAVLTFDTYDEQQTEPVLCVCQKEWTFAEKDEQTQDCLSAVWDLMQEKYGEPLDSESHQTDKFNFTAGWTDKTNVSEAETIRSYSSGYYYDPEGSKGIAVLEETLAEGAWLTGADSQ